MFIRGHQRSRGHHGSSRTVSARREANRLYPKRPTGRGRSRRRLVRSRRRLVRSRRRLVRALDRSRVPPPRTYRPMTSPIRRYRPIRRCTLHRCGRIDGDASPPPDEGGNHLMSETHLMRDVIRSDASPPPPPAHPSSELIRGHQRSSAVIRGIPSTSSCSSVIRAHQRSSRSSAVISGHQRHQSTSSCSSVIGWASSAGLCLPPGTAPGLLLLLLLPPPPPTPTPDTALDTAPLPAKPNQLPPPPGTALDESRGGRVERGEGESARDVISAKACRERI